MTTPRHALCEVPGCDRRLAVGVGIPPKWVCLAHYQEYLRDAAGLMRRIKETLTL
jgi:hypothetical protein